MKMMTKPHIPFYPLLAAIATVAVLGSATAATLPATVASPDGKLEMTLATNSDGTLSYSFKADGRLWVKPSPTGLPGGVPANAGHRSVKGVWKPVWGKRAQVPDLFNEISVDMGAYRWIGRAYNDGVAFRTVGSSDSGSGMELTRFNFAGDYTAWYYNGERHNIGPEKLSAGEGRRLPVMTIQADEHAFMSVHEADLPDGAEPFMLELIKGENAVKVCTRQSAAWRVILFGRTPGALVDSDLLELLNPPPPEGMDFSWVKPGIVLWDWRINGAKVDGFNYTMTYPSWIRMVDFAAENGFPYLMLDADWYGKEFARESNPTTGGYAADARKLIDYARSKNVGIWLYINDVAGRQYPIEKTLATYREWGAAGIKYGFMNGSPVEKNAWTQKITRLCAGNKLLCDYHDGPVHPFGQSRTWPNAVTREYCQAQLDAKRVFQPKTFVTSVFVNMLAGPLDMNNGAADLLQKGRVDNGQPVPSTLAGEIARTLIVFSGATVIPDIPEYYRKHPELLQFLAAEKMPWRESKTLSGRIGEYIVMARQAADGAWLVGAATDEAPREIDVPLSFLPSGTHEALVIQDGPTSDYRTRAEDYRAETRTITKADTLRLKLAPGGGACVLIKTKR
jgi:alpha-glucosidase